MKLEEARKRATPGPLTVEGCALLAPSGWKTDRDTWVLGASETVHIASTDENPRSYAEQAANSALLAHCFNHFDEVVGVLEEPRQIREAAKMLIRKLNDKEITEEQWMCESVKLDLRDIALEDQVDVVLARAKAVKP